MREDLEENQKNEQSSDGTYDPDDLKNTPSSQLTDWKQEPTITDLKGDLEYARQENTDQVNNVKGWLALRDTTGSESGIKSKKPGRSQVQPKLIRKHNEWRYPALSEPFLNSDRMFDVEPRTFEDTAAAKQNQILLNWQFDTKLNKVDFIDRYVRTTVDEGTCILRTGWKRETEKVLSTRKTFDYYPIQDKEQLDMLTKATELFVHDDPEYVNLPEDLQASVEYSMEKEIPVYAKETGEEQFLETKVTNNHPTVKIVPVANFFIDPSCEGVWEEADYAIYTYTATPSSLKKRKNLKNLKDVNWSENKVQSQGGNPDHTSTAPQADARVNTDKVKVLVYEYWGMFDIHDDGVMVPIVVSWIGDTIIQMEENPFPDRKMPFVIVPYMPILQSSFGEADASLLQDNQRVLGAVSRGMIDLLGRSANAQVGYAKGFLDVTNKKRFVSGEDFEYNPGNDPKAAIQQMVYPEIPNSALQMSAQQNAEAEGLSGVKSFSTGITGESYGRVARGISGAMDAAGQREMSILRRMAQGLIEVAKKFTAMNAIYLTDKEVVRVTNEEFVTVKRGDLLGNFDLKMDISTQNSDEEKSQDLGMMLQTMGPDMAPGLSQIILGKIADLKRMPDLANEIRNYEPKPDPIQQKRAELEIAEMEAKIALERAKTAEATARAENIQLDTQLDAQGTRHDRTIEAQGAQARGNRDLEVTKHLLSGETTPGNIEAAIGYNSLKEQEDTNQGNKPKPAPLPLAPLQSAQVPGDSPSNPAAPLAIPS